MAADTRERPRNWLVWVIAGVVVALAVIVVYQLTQRAQQADLPRPPEVTLSPPGAPHVPAPNLPAAPVPAPR